MLDLYLMQFSKRENSTLIPTETQLASATRISVALKGGCDILTPTFILESSNIPAGNNYAKFQDRYYFITGITSVRNNLVEITARVDVLGSWKSAIQSTTAFVLYDGTANTEIVDQRLSVVTTPTVQQSSDEIPYLSRTGNLRLCVQGDNGCEVFVLNTSRDLFDLMARMPQHISDVVSLITNETTGFQEFFETFASMGSVGGTIKSLYWVPWDAFGTINHEIHLGTYNTELIRPGLLYVNQNALCRLTTVELAIPWQFDDWRNQEPYTHVYLYIPFIGVIKLPCSEIINAESISIDFSISQINGNLTVAVYAGAYGNSPCIYSGSGSSGIAIPVGTANLNPGAIVNTLTSAAGAVLSAATLNPGGLVNSLGGLAGNGLSAITPLMTSISGGGGGSAAELDFDVRCWTVCHGTNVEPSNISSIMGTPTMQTKSLSGLTGYVQTVGFSVSGNMLDTERSQINQLLDRGIYIE